MTPTVAVLVLLAMVVVVPLGLPLLATPGLQRLQRPWPVAGALAGVSLLLAPSLVAASLTAPYLVLAVLAGGLAVRRAVVARHTLASARVGLRELAALAAGLSLPVAAGSLSSERAGYRLLGFDDGVLALTVAHFHYAGFAVAMLAGLVLVRTTGRTAVVGAAAVPAGTALVALGYFVGSALELAGALVLAIGLLAVSLAIVTSVLPPRGSSRVLLLVAAAVTPFTMALALWWAVGQLTGPPHPDVAVMAATHGVANALGVGLCGLLGWRLLRPAAV